jgi:hypothetical protein
MAARSGRGAKWVLITSARNDSGGMLFSAGHRDLRHLMLDGGYQFMIVLKASMGRLYRVNIVNFR